MLVLSDLHRREVGPEEAQYLIDLIYAERLLALLQFPDEAQAYAAFSARSVCVSAYCRRICFTYSDNDIDMQYLYPLGCKYTK